MQNIYQIAKEEIINRPRVWLITGVAGFIGSNLLEALLKLNQRVIGLDNFATGHQANLDAVQTLVEPTQWKNFHFHQGDIRDLATCRNACEGVEHVLHQAALGSVPRSINDPITTNNVNVDGFLNMLVAAKDSGARTFTYAASSSTYGDHPSLPKIEETIGNPLSPYAVTKYVNELYAGVFSRVYGFHATGLRYFNVFGRRQDPKGAYAAVIPKWTAALLNNEEVFINGDGQTSRDFCYIDNVIQANILSATKETASSQSEIYNIAVGQQTNLNELFKLIKQSLAAQGFLVDRQPKYREGRAGDVKHSLASIDKAARQLGYAPTHSVAQGMLEAVAWYIDENAKKHR